MNTFLYSFRRYDIQSYIYIKKVCQKSSRIFNKISTTSINFNNLINICNENEIKIIFFDNFIENSVDILPYLFGCKKYKLALYIQKKIISEDNTTYSLILQKDIIQRAFFVWLKTNNIHALKHFIKRTPITDILPVVKQFKLNHCIYK